jgi:hypothetical protein
MDRLDGGALALGWAHALMNRPAGGAAVASLQALPSQAQPVAGTRLHLCSLSISRAFRQVRNEIAG